MKKLFAHKFSILIALFCISVTTSFAQTPPTPLAGARYFNWTFDSLTTTEKSAFTGNVTVKTAVDGDSLIFGGANSTSTSKNKGGYLGAAKCTSVELPLYASLGYFSFYVQNGSSGSNQDISVKIYDGSTWITVETTTMAGNADQRIISSASLSKKAVKVKIESAGTFWFYQIEAWSSTQASVNPTEVPKILSITPAGGSVVPSTGIVTIQFDEIVKVGTGSVTFGAGTVTPIYLGNTLQINYSNLIGPSNTLTIPLVFVQNNENTNMAKDTSINYIGDIVDPVYQSASPVNTSNIVINDVVQKIKLIFNEPVLLGTGTIGISPAAPGAIFTPSASGDTILISYSGLAYSTPYTLTVPANFVTDISGNTYKSVITLNYTTYPADNIPPTLSSQSVANTATNVPIGGSIAFTFNENMELGSGGVTINGMSTTLSFNGFVVGVNYLNFDYNTLYTVTIPPGAVTDTTGNAYAGTSFTFTTKAFASKAFDFIVAKDASGTHSSIQAAVNSVTDNLSTRTFIYVKNGTYTEKVLIPATKQNISLIGQDSAKTILTFSDHAGAPGLSTDLSYTIDIKAPGFYAENISIKNTWPSSGGSGNQAVALMTEGDKQVFKNCKLTSLQDTHYPKVASTRNYYLNCYIEGNTDFMFGGATAFFEACSINCLSSGQFTTAPSGTTREFGLVYNNCTITPGPGVGSQSFYLGRPWKDFGKTVWLNTKMGPHIIDLGWSQWTSSGPDADNQYTGFYAEYNSMNLAGTPINPTRAAWGVKLTTPQAARYTIDNIFNYGVGQSTWNPLPYSTTPLAPTGLTITGTTLNWSTTSFAVAYVVFRNDSVIGTTTSLSYNDLAAPAGSNSYKIKAVNEYGAQSLASAAILGIDAAYFSNEGIQLYPNPFADVITIKNSEKVKSVAFFTEEGRLVKQVEAASIIKTSDLNAGYYILKVTANNGAVNSIKMIKR